MPRPLSRSRKYCHESRINQNLNHISREKMQNLQFCPLWLGVRLEFWYIEISQVPMTDVYARIRRSYGKKNRRPWTVYNTSYYELFIAHSHSIPFSPRIRLFVLGNQNYRDNKRGRHKVAYHKIFLNYSFGSDCNRYLKIRLDTLCLLHSCIL